MRVQVTVRLATTADVTAIAAIYIRYLREYGHDADLESTVRFLECRLTERWVLFFLATDRSAKVVGFVGCSLTYSAVSQSQAIRINDMFVDEEVRRRGVATTLLTMIDTHCLQNGLAKIFLQAAPDAASAIALYTKVGFHLKPFVSMTKELGHGAA